ncbi:MAG TPA: ABC transporter transmembrane domain-containing protein, partial [Clostridia bacterium]|nr:ABC transporter transmembrane domain-containing protein [Clostridia bacterium]
TGNRLAQAEKAVSERNEAFVGTVKDLLTGFPVIKSFKAELEARCLFDGENGRTEEAKRKRRVTEHTIRVLGAATGIAAQLGVFLFGAYLAVSHRAVTPGVVIIFVQLMNFVLQPISEVPPILASRKASLALVEKLAEAAGAHVRTGGKAVGNRLDMGIEVGQPRAAGSERCIRGGQELCPGRRFRLRQIHAPEPAHGQLRFV